MDEEKINIRLFIKDIKENEFDDNKDITVTNRKVIINDIEYRQIKCHSKDQLIELLKYYSIDLKEGYDKNNEYSNDKELLFDILSSIIYRYTCEIFVVFCKIFKKSLQLNVSSAYVQSLSNQFNYANDPSLYTHLINHFVFKCGKNLPHMLEQLIYLNFGRNDSYYDKYLELMLSLERNLTADNIMNYFNGFRFNLERIIDNNIERNNHNYINLIILFSRKYYPKKIIPYGPSIARAIIHNEIEISETLLNWYLYDCDNFKSDDMIEIYPNIVHNEFNELYVFKLNRKQINLDSLNFLHRKVVDNKFYSEKVIQMVILSSIEMEDDIAFTYLITVFPYEAIALIINEQYRKYQILPFYNDYYKQIRGIKERLRGMHQIKIDSKYII